MEAIVSNNLKAGSSFQICRERMLASNNINNIRKACFMNLLQRTHRTNMTFIIRTSQISIGQRMNTFDTLNVILIGWFCIFRHNQILAIVFLIYSNFTYSNLFPRNSTIFKFLHLLLFVEFHKIEMSTRIHCTDIFIQMYQTCRSIQTW